MDKKKIVLLVILAIVIVVVGLFIIPHSISPGKYSKTEVLFWSTDNSPIQLTDEQSEAISGVVDAYRMKHSFIHFDSNDRSDLRITVMYFNSGGFTTDTRGLYLNGTSDSLVRGLWPLDYYCKVVNGGELYKEISNLLKSWGY